MIRYRVGKLVGLGLSEMNLQKLREGRPILIRGPTVGLPEIDIAIHYGATEHALYQELASQGIDLPGQDWNADGSPLLRFRTLEEVASAMAQLEPFLKAEPATVDDRNRVMRLADAAQRFVEENAAEIGEEQMRKIRAAWAPLRARMNEWGS